jgi:hypothetical protein
MTTVEHARAHRHGEPLAIDCQSGNPLLVLVTQHDPSQRHLGAVVVHRQRSKHLVLHTYDAIHQSMCHGKGAAVSACYGATHQVADASRANLRDD